MVLEGRAIGSRFGDRIANAGDINGDGYSDILIAAPRRPITALGEAGEVSMYLGTNTTPNATATRRWPGAVADGNFPSALGANEDCNGDGFADILFGANRATVMGIEAAGAVYSCAGSSMGPAAGGTAAAEGTFSTTEFGRAIPR